MTVHHDWDQIDAQELSPLVPGGFAPRPRALPLRAAAAPAPLYDPVKRGFDIGFALLLLLPLSLVMGAVAVLLWVRQGRPIFYKARRMRTPERAFTQLKFRTMACDDAEDGGATGAHKHWRITRIGHFLRRTRIDELPQLFNILAGDMSFVGPRPPLREYVDRFPVEYARVLRARPGVTGLATLIYHRHEDRLMAACATAEATEATYYRRCLPVKLQIEDIYLRRRSMAMDLWIMWHTVKAVVTQRDVRIPRHQRPASLRQSKGSGA